MKIDMMVVAVGILLCAGPAFAADPAKGESDFRKCKACHAVITPDGTAVVKGGKTGPNLFGVIGRQIGGDPDYGYSASLVAAGADGATWTEADLASYLVDPSGWLKERLGDQKAKSKMTLKLPKGGEDIAAWLATVN